VWVAIAADTALTAVVGAESLDDVSPLAAPAFATIPSALALAVLVATGVAALRGATRNSAA
jgi:hypothetical protein